MKIISWNINGLRSMKSHLREIVGSLSADIICLQETKLTRDQIEEDVALLEGYNSYYSFSKRRSGYSGVATICRNGCAPVAAEEGLADVQKTALRQEDDAVGRYGDQSWISGQDLLDLDSEGRALLTQHEIKCPDGSSRRLTVINVYCPRAEMDNVVRNQYRMRFYKMLQLRAEALLQAGSHVIILGDINVSHKPIDSAKFEETDRSLFAANEGRQWLNEFLVETSTDGALEESSEKQFVDSFRYFHPNLAQAFTCWCTVTGGRQTNYGTRLDYIFADSELLLKTFVSSDILPDIDGSDHCPVTATLNVDVVPSTTLPSLCTKHWPEFSGRQKKLVDFFGAARKIESASPIRCQTAKRKSDEPQVKTQKKAKSNPQQKSLLNFVRTSSERTDERKSQTKEKSACEKNEPCVSISKEVRELERRNSASESWKSLFKGPEKPPSCKGHDEPCVSRTVKKVGENWGRQFYVCARPDGHKTNPEARCNFFQWKTKLKNKN